MIVRRPSDFVEPRLPSKAARAEQVRQFDCGRFSDWNTPGSERMFGPCGNPILSAPNAAQGIAASS
jgi:hypothetical protein